MRFSRRSALVLLISIVCAQCSAAEPVCETLRSPKESVYSQTDLYEFYSLSKLEKLAKARDAHALNSLGVRYGTGKGVTKDSVRSFEYYRRAAELGMPLAQANLAYMYLSGEGTTKDAAAAFEWAKQSAQMGDTLGLQLVGYMLGTGEGTVKDQTEAAYCYLLAARRGSVEAQVQLSFMYESGLGVPVNLREAAAWRSRARTARETQKPWQDLSPDPPMPADWQSPLKWLSNVASGSTVDNEHYSFQAVTPAVYRAQGWDRYARSDEPLLTAMRTGLLGYDTYALAIMPKGRLSDGESIASAAHRLVRLFDFTEVPNRPECVRTSNHDGERVGKDQLLMTAYCAHDGEIFELAVSWQSIRGNATIASDDAGLTGLRESMDALVSSFQFK